jgi:hypothetical protein
MGRGGKEGKVGERMGGKGRGRERGTVGRRGAGGEGKGVGMENVSPTF